MRRQRIDPILQNIEDIKGIGQWIECKTEVRLVGVKIPSGENDIEVLEVLLKEYTKQK